MSLENLLSRLSKVKRTGDSRYIACCPAHEDKSPSMTIRELPDGRILMHCFGGCATESILGSVGLTFSDLFPEQLIQNGKSERRPFNAHDVLACIKYESRLAAIASVDIAKGRILSEAEKERLLIAAGRLNEAYEVCNGY
jgi:hypothetical protein